MEQSPRAGGKLSGRRALITGASAGIGLATARLFAQEGASVVGLDRQWDASVEGMTCLTGDVTSYADVSAAVEQAGGEEGLDIMLANAGVGVVDDWLTGDLEAWARVIDVNLIGVMRCFQAAAVNMVRHGRKGRLLATASISGLRPAPDLAAYCASKAGVISVVESAAIAFAANAITVNAVAPGSVDTALQWQAVHDHAAAQGRTSDEVYAEMSVPLGRWASGSDIAEAFLYLASDAADHVTGSTIRVDGGQLLV